jgi:hypothetical protein
MPDKEKGTTRVQDLAGTEQKGLVQDVVVPVVQAGVSGAVGGYVGSKFGQGKNPPPEKTDD